MPDDGDRPHALDAYRHFAEITALQFKQIAEVVDELKAQSKAQAEADLRRGEVYSQRWQQEHDAMLKLCAGLDGVRRDLQSQSASLTVLVTQVEKKMDLWVTAFQRELAQIKAVQHESRRNDAIIAGVTILGILLLWVLGIRPP